MFRAAKPPPASCIDPALPEGVIVYNSSFKVLQYCDGADWIAMHPHGIGGCTLPDKPEGTLVYNPDYRVVQGCSDNE